MHGITGGYETPLAMACKEAGFIVSIVDGAKIACFRGSFSSTGASTDKRSAYLLARYCRERKPEEWFPVPDEYRKFRELNRHRERLLQSKTEWSARAAHLVEDELVAAQRLAIIQVLVLQVEELESRIAEHLKAHAHLGEAVRLLMTIPGIAFKSAFKIVAESGPIENYPTARAYALAAGLVPIVRHSGKSTPPGRLPVYGNRALRCALYFPAVVCYGHRIGVWPHMERLTASGAKLKMTVITAGMRKLAHIVFGILTSGKPYDPGI